MTIGSTLGLTFFPLWFRLILVCLLLLGSTVLYLAMWLAAMKLVLLALGSIYQSGRRLLISLPRQFLTLLGVSPEKTADSFENERAHQQQYQEEQRDHVGRKQAAQSEDHYSILGVPAGASQQAIQSAYREQMKLYHPDRVEHLGEALRRLAHEQSIKIQNAYDALYRGKKYARG